jgi:hypothetical protein
MLTVEAVLSPLVLRKSLLMRFTNFPNPSCLSPLDVGIPTSCSSSRTNLSLVADHEMWLSWFDVFGVVASAVLGGHVISTACIFYRDACIVRRNCAEVLYDKSERQDASVKYHVFDAVINPSVWPSRCAIGPW